MRCRWLVIQAFVLIGLISSDLVSAKLLADDGQVHFDFRLPEVATRWEPTHAVELSSVDRGLKIKITGDDPYLTGPLFKPANDAPMIAKIVIESDVGGGAQLFFYGLTGPQEELSVKFAVPTGGMTEILVPLPRLGPLTRFRFDPPGSTGNCIIESLTLLTGINTEWPVWQTFSPLPAADAVMLSSGCLELRCSKFKFGQFEILVDGRPMGTSGVIPQIAIEHDGHGVWLPLRNDRVEVIGEHTVRATATAALPGGGEITLQQQFVRSLDGLIEVQAMLASTKVCRLIYAPLFLVFPGDRAFGDQKGQALFPGVEYLENEPSSSDADVDAARALRKVPAAHKITFPLMTIQADKRYLGLIWEPFQARPFGVPQSTTAAMFDSPDRTFGTGAHLMGLIAPNAIGGRREDGHVLPRLATELDPHQPIELSAQLIAGRGETVIPAVERYIALRGIPHHKSLPPPIEFAERLAPGWLNPPLRDGPRFRHAVAGDAFQGQPAADAVWMMQQLAATFDTNAKSDSPTTARHLRQAAQASLAALPPGTLHHAAVGHIQVPNATLLLGDPLEGMRQAHGIASQQLAQFGPQGKLEYTRHPTRPDFSRTHWSKETNGFAAPVVARALQEAAFSGDPVLIGQAIEQLRNLDRYANSVPRGAQTWEIPLHTPDILASAYLVKAYTLGYELTRDPKFLEQAQYWAWTGIPFVYLHPSIVLTGHRIGPYATIPVLGATHWDSVLWIGLPVQWCGLVYADALQHLSQYDQSGPWDELATGIVLSGIDQTYPEHAPHSGLLPDSYNIVTQSRNPADINPGTLQVPAMRALLHWESYDVAKVVETGWTIHAPGSIQLVSSHPTSIAFNLKTWSIDPYSVVIHGLPSQPMCHYRRDDLHDNDSNQPEAVTDQRFLPETGTLILKLQGSGMVTLSIDEASSSKEEKVKEGAEEGASR